MDSEAGCGVHGNRDFISYCSDHETPCCVSCIQKTHRLCDNIIPLEEASKFVHSSALLTDCFQELDDITKTATELLRNREQNLINIENAKEALLIKIKNYKDNMLQRIDVLERTVTMELNDTNRRQRSQIQREKTEVEATLQKLTQTRSDIEALKDQGTNIKLFLALHKHSNELTETKQLIKEMTSSIKNLDIQFDEFEMSFDAFGSVTEISQPCGVVHTSSKVQQAQVKPDKQKPLTGFSKEGEVKLKQGDVYSLTDLTVTPSNQLLLCNGHYRSPKVYKYTNCKDYDREVTLTSGPTSIAFIPGTDRVLVTLPRETSIQFIIIATMTTANKVNVTFTCQCITAVEDKIFIGDDGGKVHIMDTKGSHQMAIYVGQPDNIQGIHYNSDNHQILCRLWKDVKCIDLQGKLVYEFAASGGSGMTIDHQGHVYVAGFWNDDVKRYSRQGEALETVLIDDGLYSPRSLSFNNDFTKFFVINNSSQSLWIFKSV